ncbi:hypothetical protein M231_04958 [Tremella mesenterica]|uniref:Uncharacterized protein n=1 Tax=Tremella mesenterica TaxID=5217 RepID=A0A4Q1BJJ8_TREME|nr:hypothetical protein M231_04958 [Tremella mesenterica]
MSTGCQGNGFFVISFLRLRSPTPSKFGMNLFKNLTLTDSNNTNKPLSPLIQISQIMPKSRLEPSSHSSGRSSGPKRGNPDTDHKRSKDGPRDASPPISFLSRPKSASSTFYDGSSSLAEDLSNLRSRRGLHTYTDPPGRSLDHLLIAAASDGKHQFPDTIDPLQAPPKVSSGHTFNSPTNPASSATDQSPIIPKYGDTETQFNEKPPWISVRGFRLLSESFPEADPSEMYHFPLFGPCLCSLRPDHTGWSYVQLKMEATLNMVEYLAISCAQTANQRGWVMMTRCKEDTCLIWSDGKDFCPDHDISTSSTVVGS